MDIDGVKGIQSGLTLFTVISMKGPNCEHPPSAITHSRSTCNYKDNSIDQYDIQENPATVLHAIKPFFFLPPPPEFLSLHFVDEIPNSLIDLSGG